MKKFNASPLAISLTLSILALPTVQAATPGTLPDAVEKAILRNPEVMARLHDYQAADAERDVARGGLFPRVDLQGYTGRERRDTPISPVSTYNRPGYQLQLRQLPQRNLRPQLHPRQPLHQPPALRRSSARSPTISP